MKNLLVLLLVASSLLSCNPQETTKTTKSDSNEHLVMATLWYQRSSECRALYYQAYNFAKLSLDKQLANPQNKLPKAVVVDIDETVVDNSPFTVNSIRTGKGYTKQLWKEWTDKGSAKATPGSLEFLKYAASKGVETFYISNRSVKATASTLKNLQNLGFPFADEKHFLLKTTTSDKTDRRNTVAKTHDILIFAGDNIGDFDALFEARGENYGFNQVDSLRKMFGSKYIVLPNPMYGGWERQALKNTNHKPETVGEKNQIRRDQLIGYEEAAQ